MLKPLSKHSRLIWPQDEIIYPDSDGKLMADNTLQFGWIMTIQGGLDLLFEDDPNVFVAGDLLWYPEEGNNKLRVAPDAMVAFGRPKGHRGSYKQWVEDNIPPQVVFEILSPGNSTSEMIRKWHFYNRYKVDEYYLYDPSKNTIDGWLRRDGELEVIDANLFTDGVGWTSPHLKVTLRLADATLELIRPDGIPFATYVELGIQLDQERARADEEGARADSAEARAEEERVRAEKERTRAERLEAQLRALGIDPNNI